MTCVTRRRRFVIVGISPRKRRARGEASDRGMWREDEEQTWVEYFGTGGTEGEAVHSAASGGNYDSLRECNGSPRLIALAEQLPDDEDGVHLIAAIKRGMKGPIRIGLDAYHASATSGATRYMAQKKLHERSSDARAVFGIRGEGNRRESRNANWTLEFSSPYLGIRSLVFRPDIWSG